MLILNILSLSAQNKGKVLQIKNSENKKLVLVTGIYHNEKGEEIVSTQSDFNGNIFLLNNYKTLSLRRIGYKDSVLNLNELTKDTISVTLENERYPTPTLIINKATLKHRIDYSNYLSDIIVKRIVPYEVSSDTTYFDDGTFDFEIIDSLRVSYKCKIAIPNKWDTEYKNFYRLFVSKLESNNLAAFVGNKASIDFQIRGTGEVVIESMDGFQNNYKNWFISYLKNWRWKPSDIFGRRVDTKYKMLIQLE